MPPVLTLDRRLFAGLVAVSVAGLTSGCLASGRVDIAADDTVEVDVIIWVGPAGDDQGRPYADPDPCEGTRRSGVPLQFESTTDPWIPTVAGCHVTGRAPLAALSPHLPLAHVGARYVLRVSGHYLTDLNQVLIPRVAGTGWWPGVSNAITWTDDRVLISLPADQFARLGRDLVNERPDPDASIDLTVTFPGPVLHAGLIGVASGALAALAAHGLLARRRRGAPTPDLRDAPAAARVAEAERAPGDANKNPLGAVGEPASDGVQAPEPVEALLEPEDHSVWAPDGEAGEGGR